MTEWWHIIDRFIIHFFSSFGVYLAAFFLLRFAWRGSQFFRIWFGPLHRNRAAVSLVCLVWLGIWEGANVIAGQTLLKLVTDVVSWLTGLATAAWAQWRYWKAVSEEV